MIVKKPVGRGGGGGGKNIYPVHKNGLKSLKIALLTKIKSFYACVCKLKVV